MVTDKTSTYMSPAGKEFALAAGRLSGINPASRIIDLGCGYGDSACNLASEFRCRVTAFDSSRDNIEFARKQAVERSVSHLIDFRIGDICKADYGKDLYDLILAEGGIFSFIGREKGLKLAIRCVRLWAGWRFPT
jgi:ubiquinone/menaquinone biosynthesis C-methylase UbiE